MHFGTFVTAIRPRNNKGDLEGISPFCFHKLGPLQEEWICSYSLATAADDLSTGITQLKNRVQLRDGFMASSSGQRTFGCCNPSNMALTHAHYPCAAVTTPEPE
jgi:hypothetical protein